MANLAATLIACSALLFQQPPPAARSADVALLHRAGLEELGRRDYESLKRARESFAGAIALDREFAPAHAGLAEAHALLGDYDAAERAALRALELDDSLARGHATLAFVRLHAHWDWRGAEREFRAAIALDPSAAVAHHWHAILLEVTGRHDEAVVAAKRALELEPAVQAHALGVAYRLFWARRYDEAVARLERLLAGDRNLVSAHYFLGRCHTELGRLRRARAALGAARRLAPRDLNVTAALGYLHARSGRRAEAETGLGELQRFAELGYPLSTQIASIYAALGDLDAALSWLEQAYREHEGPLAWLKVDPRFDALRSDPRLAALLAKMELQPKVGRVPAAATRPPRDQIEAARAYEELHVPALFRQWAPRVLQAAAIEPGHRVLDVACGTGVLARAGGRP